MTTPSETALSAEPPEWIDLAADIRAVDGNHDLGAGALAAALTARGWTRAARSQPAPEGLDAERLATALLRSHSAAKWSVQPYGDVVPWSWRQIAEAVVAEYRLAATEPAGDERT